MSSFLGDVRDRYRESMKKSMDKAWVEVIEPAIKESYRNGVRARQSRRSEVAAGERYEP